MHVSLIIQNYSIGQNIFPWGKRVKLNSGLTQIEKFEQGERSQWRRAVRRREEQGGRGGRGGVETAETREAGEGVAVGGREEEERGQEGAEWWVQGQE